MGSSAGAPARRNPSQTNPPAGRRRGSVADGDDGVPLGDRPVGEGPVSALPSVLARVTAFVSIFVGAGAAAMIGHTFADLGGFSGLMVGFLTFASMLLGAGGVAVVAVLTLRAFGEWETIRDENQ